MWKVALVLVLTALAILVAPYDAPAAQTRVGELTGTAISAPLAPPLMYAGVRG